MQQVLVLRPFADGRPDHIVHPGDRIEMHADRARELAEHGLVQRIETAKAAPPPDNKMAPAPANKAAVPLDPDELPTLPKRGPGRPRKVRD